MQDCTRDSQRLGGIPIPALLFANDTLLISQTPMGLQNLLNTFSDFCGEKGFEVNTAKIKYMLYNPYKSFTGNFNLKGSTLHRVDRFDYLGISLDDVPSWSWQLH